MLNTNNEINIKKEERKHSWSTVFAWLYLKTIGRILPKRWSRWAENILYYDKTTANNEVQTDAFKTVDESVQVDLKPEVTEKESQSVVISKDGGVQTDGVAFQDTAMQTECVEKIDKNIEADLKPEVAEKDGEITSEDEGIYSEVSDGSTDEDCFDIENELIENNYCEVYGEDDEALKEHLEDISQELELERLQNASLKKENIELQSVIERLEKDYEEFIEDAGKREEKLTEYKMEFINKTRKLSAEVEEKDAKINSLTLLNEALKQDIKEIETRSNEQQQIAEIYMKLNELLSNVTEISERTSQLHNQEQQEEKKSLENKILELQKQVQTLEGSNEWELAGIDGTLKETFLTIMELLAQQLLNNQEQSVKEQKLEELTLSYNDQAHQMERLQLENLSLGVKNGKLLSVIERSITEEAEVRKMGEQVGQNQYRLINQIVKLEGALKEKEEQLKESQRTLESLEYRLESLESQSTTAKVQQRKDSSHQINTKSITKSEADLSHEKKASFVRERTNNLYNEKFVQSYTNSLPEDALEKSIKTKAKSLDSSNVQKLAKNISNEFTLPKNTNSTPNSFLSRTSSTASINSLNVRVGS